MPITRFVFSYLPLNKYISNTLTGLNTGSDKKTSPITKGDWLSWERSSEVERISLDSSTYAIFSYQFESVVKHQAFLSFPLWSRMFKCQCLASLKMAYILQSRETFFTFLLYSQYSQSPFEIGEVFLSDPEELRKIRSIILQYIFLFHCLCNSPICSRKTFPTPALYKPRLDWQKILFWCNTTRNLR